MRPDEVPERLISLFKEACLMELEDGSTATDAQNAGLAVVLTAWQQEVQEKAARVIEDVIGNDFLQSSVRPKFANGRHLNDWQWAAELARWGYPRG